MNCAAELIIKKQEAIAKYQAKIDALKIERLKKTINFAEVTIDTALTKQAEERNDLEYYFEANVDTDELGQYFQVIHWYTPYADGLKNGSPNTERLDYFGLINYLEKYCLTFSDSGAIYKYAIITKKDIHHYNRMRVYVAAPGPECLNQGS